MKKYLLSVFAAASMLFAASCSEEENFVESNKQSVTFKVEVEDAGASSRALTPGGKSVGEGSMIDRVHYAVYEASGEKKFLTKGDAVMTPTEDGAVGSVVIPLVNGLSFDIVFFAHNADGSAFTIPTNGDLTKLEFNTTLKANQESYDAFYFTLPGFQVTNSSTTPVTLKRAVAQLNVGTTEADLSYADALKALATMSEITLTNVPTKFNARTGEVDDRTSVTFNASNILMDADWVKDASNANPYGNEMLENVKTNDRVEDFYYLAMAYVLAGDEPALHDATFTFYRGEGDNKEAISERSLSSVRLQRNYRTNVTGNVLTQQEKFDVSLDINFGDEEHNYSVGDVVVVANEKQFEEVIKKNAEEENPVPVEIQLTDHITLGGSRSVAFSRAENELPYALKIDADQEITIDLNGFTISQTKAQTKEYSMIQNNGVLTIKDSSTAGTGKISYTDTGNGGEYISNTITNYGTLTIESGIIANMSSATVGQNGYPYVIDNNSTSQNATLNIKGGKLHSAGYSAIRAFANSTVNDNIVNIESGEIVGTIEFQSPNTNANKANLNISGGKVSNNATDNALFIFGANGDASQMNISITGGEFIGNIKSSSSMPIGENFNSKFITGGTFNTDPSAFVDDNCKVVANEDVWTIVAREPIAKIGSTEYVTLQAAFDNVNDGETILLLNNITIDNSIAGYHDGTYTDGVRYTSDKSFTVDFNGKTVTDDGCVNDYLIYVNNKGDKDNKITFMNGTIISKNGCWSTVCVNSSSATHATELNLVGMNITNSNDAKYSGNPAVRARDKATVNVGDNTVITSDGASYGIAANTSASIVNINAGAKVIQQNSGTTGGNSVFAAVGGKGTINIYDGSEITSDGYGVHTMTTGTPVVNVYGGTITAEVALKASTNGGTGELAYIYVTGGIINGELETYTNNGHIVVSGGTFSVDPTHYLVDGYEAVKSNGVWTIKTLPVAKIGETEYETMEAAAAAAQAGSTITVLRDVTLSEALTLPADIIFNGNGKQINGTISAGGNLTFEGHTKVTAFSATYYNRTITIVEGACLEVTGTGRVTLGYGNTFNITGSIEDAKTADKANVQPSLIIPAGISITGDNNAAFNVTNAYVKIGNTASKNSAANGTFTLNFTNAIAEFTNQFTLSEPTSGKNPTFNVNVTNSVFTTAAKLCIAAAKSIVAVDNSIVTSNTNIRNSGTISLTKGSVLTGSTIQFGENGGNNGTINVDNSTLTVTASSTGHAFDGQGIGSINLTNSANANVDYYKNMTISVDQTSTFTGTKVK